MIRRRCSECRTTFIPARSASATQRVCSATCRLTRVRKLARKRRGQELEQARADERARQQSCRQRRAEELCHVPASARKSAIPREEVGKLVDRALALSRASLERDLPRFLEQFVEEAGEAMVTVTPQPPRVSA